jgi:hypothetical protein
VGAAIKAGQSDKTFLKEAAVQADLGQEAVEEDGGHDASGCDDKI